MTELLYKELTFAVIGAAMEVHRLRRNFVYQAQAIMHYLTATGLRLALLLNFSATSLQHHRVIK